MGAGTSASHFTLHTSLKVSNLGLVEYQPTFEAMKAFTAQRGPETPDEIWLLQHPPVYTLGLAGKPEHLLHTTGIPLVKIDRGGQITYHGPGQIVIYLLLNLKRLGIGVKELVRRLEQAIIDLLAEYGVPAERRDKAPGVYVGEAKIAALGLRIKNNCSYHGLCLNVDMDLAPYANINPCGYAGLQVTQTRDHGIRADAVTLAEELARQLQLQLGYTHFPINHGAHGENPELPVCPVLPVV
ncbi:MAG: lipoyl(octanoyl) transferase LipB [Sulfurimicrobium sp.]|nr:lipoyl(octanoyl) transferase LipB [Sulfurimicrobium sp.]MDZ7656205.1 lipoyl(octanoyl) transferase LipB [Sulfurimicrobium sp.]